MKVLQANSKNWDPLHHIRRWFEMYRALQNSRIRRLRISYIKVWRGTVWSIKALNRKIQKNYCTPLFTILILFTQQIKLVTTLISLYKLQVCDARFMSLLKASILKILRTLNRQRRETFSTRCHTQFLRSSSTKQHIIWLVVATG